MGVSTDYMRLTLFPFERSNEMVEGCTFKFNHNLGWLGKKVPHSILSIQENCKVKEWDLKFQAKARRKSLSCMGEIQVSSRRLSASPTDKEVLAYTFVEGLDHNTKILLDLAAGVHALEKTIIHKVIQSSRVMYLEVWWRILHVWSRWIALQHWLHSWPLFKIKWWLSSASWVWLNHRPKLKQFSRFKLGVKFVVVDVEQIREVNFVGTAQKGNQNYGIAYNRNWHGHPNYFWGNNQVQLSNFSSSKVFRKTLGPAV